MEPLTTDQLSADQPTPALVLEARSILRRFALRLLGVAVLSTVMLVSASIPLAMMMNLVILAVYFVHPNRNLQQCRSIIDAWKSGKPVEIAPDPIPRTTSVATDPRVLRILGDHRLTAEDVATVKALRHELQQCQDELAWFKSHEPRRQNPALLQRIAELESTLNRLYQASIAEASSRSDDQLADLEERLRAAKELERYLAGKDWPPHGS